MKILAFLRRAVPLATLILVALALVWIWGVGERTGQDRVMTTSLVVLLTLLVGILWLVLLSGWRWYRRLLALLVLVGAVGLIVSSVRVVGVTGDLVPILDWKWGDSQRATVRLEVPPPRDLGEISFPQFLGPRRDATVTEVALATDWQARPPEEIWRRPVGEGWSAFAVGDGLAVTQEQHDDEERVVAYRLESGEEVWSHGYAARYASPIAGVGPRATPTLAGGRVFTVGATGRVTALQLADGSLLWSRDLFAELQAPLPEWGVAGSPLVVDDLVVVSVGGSNRRSLVALDAATGELRWSGGDDRAGYSSPVRVNLAGMEQILSFNQASMTAHDPADGTVLWSVEWPPAQPNVAQPLVLPPDRVLLSTGYGQGSRLYRIGRSADGEWQPEMLWKSPRLKAKFTTIVSARGAIFGLDDGTLVSLDPETGERHWKRGRYGHGQTLLVGDVLLIVTEKGEVVLVVADPTGHRELARMQALSGKTWNNPALAGPYLLVRNNREAVCYRLPLTAAGDLPVTPIPREESES
ncbi:MAG: PQQ-binding-like beta-propeller repeat protein [Acidobacteriota bacterium]